MNNMDLKEYTRIGEKVFSGVLPNGLRIKVIEKPEFVTGYAVFATRYGGAWRRFRLDGELIDTPAGIAHFLEHKMFDMPDGENALEVLAANGANPNAFTASDVTCYYFESTESFEENLRMLLKFVSTPYFTDETVQKEQGIIGQEIMMGEDNPGNRIYYNFLKLLYSSHPIRDEIAGTVESIAGITAKTLYDCHRVFYNPVNMVLIVEGPVEAEKIYDIALETVTAECGTMPEADFGPDEGTSPHERFREEAMEVSLPQFLFGSKIKPEHGDLLLKQKLTATLSLNLLLGTSSGFYNDLYKKGLLNPGFGYDADYSCDLGTIFIEGESRDPSAVFERFREAVKDVCENGIEESYFKRMKKALYGSLIKSLEDFEGVCLSLMDGMFSGYDPMMSVQCLDSVMLGDCLDFIKENLSDDRLAMSVINPIKNGDAGNA